MKYRIEGPGDSLAHTLKPQEVFGPNHRGEAGLYSHTHASGWTIHGEIHDDYCQWVNDFEASHPTLGWVKGNFETIVEAKSRKGYDHFIAHHPPETWDYADI